MVKMGRHKAALILLSPVRYPQEREALCSSWPNFPPALLVSALMVQAEHGAGCRQSMVQRAGCRQSTVHGAGRAWCRMQAEHGAGCRMQAEHGARCCWGQLYPPRLALSWEGPSGCWCPRSDLTPRAHAGNRGHRQNTVQQSELQVGLEAEEEEKSSQNEADAQA